MKHNILKSLKVGLLLYIALVVVGSLVWSSEYRGTCGILSEPCSFFDYFGMNLVIYFIPSFLALPILLIISVLSAIKFKTNSFWFYLINGLGLILAFIIITFDIFELF